MMNLFRTGTAFAVLSLLFSCSGPAEEHHEEAEAATATTATRSRSARPRSPTPGCASSSSPPSALDAETTVPARITLDPGARPGCPR
jgi:hypothetical protein